MVTVRAAVASSSDHSAKFAGLFGKENAMSRSSESILLNSALDSRRQAAIHQAAWHWLAASLQGLNADLVEDDWKEFATLSAEGAFVTLKRQGHLRACCGVFGRSLKLMDSVRQAATRTGTQDVRLPPITPRELPFCELDVSLLQQFQTLPSDVSQRVSAIETGRHGLHVRQGQYSGLLLPSVAVEHGLDAEQFLEQTCRKAGLPATAWLDPDTEIATFETINLSGPFPNSARGLLRDPSGIRVTVEELAVLAEHCRRNLWAQFRGATPSFYTPGGSDGSLPAVVLLVHVPRGESPLKFVQVALRPGVPLQATLLNLTASAAGILRQRDFTEEELGKVRVGLTLLTDTALQGTLASADLRGVDPRRHTLMVIEANRTVLVHQPELAAEQLLEQVNKEAKVLHPGAAQLLSLETYSTEPRLLITNSPPPQSGPTIRPAAVAGTFYPRDAGELRQLLADLIPTDAPPPGDWPALMVPHAGLKYSGAIAARTWQRVVIPPTVIVLGPKHTPYGVDWGIAPHATWDIPGARIPADPELAAQLVAAVPGLQLDSAAHQREHAIEVELPWIHHFSPQSRVVGITIGTGDYARCCQFAEGLAAVIRAMDTRPLLAISSDMNHFADDVHNRQLDRIALDALARLDPQHLFDTIRRHAISMCGLLPAVIVMETLRQLGGLTECEEVAYGTSADVSGDTSRVVGYAGALLR
jgi:AmmeMemoRadiSam system protein B/AmmeMemoRadiSam system protein A